LYFYSYSLVTKTTGSGGLISGTLIEGLGYCCANSKRWHS